MRIETIMGEFFFSLEYYNCRVLTNRAMPMQFFINVKSILRTKISSSNFKISVLKYKMYLYYSIQSSLSSGIEFTDNQAVTQWYERRTSKHLLMRQPANPMDLTKVVQYYQTQVRFFVCYI